VTIVERALEKLRRSAEEAPAALVQPVGALVDEPAPHAAHAPAVGLAPTRHVVVDRDALRREGFMPDPSRDRQFADQYRQIKRPIIAAALTAPRKGGPSPRAVMMTSALPGDGKTFTSINLALSMARERDVSVVLVDGDAPKPHVSRIFGLDQERGLFDALADPTVDIESLVLPTDVNGLSILPAGGRSEGATELLASERMASVVARLVGRSARRIVLFDSPPLLLAPESRALTVVAGQVVLVVRSGTTPRQAVLDALSIIGEEHAVSLVLNQGRVSFDGGYYGYYQGTYGDNSGSPT